VPSKIYHATFNGKLFTIDRDYRLCVNPAFDTDSDLLQRTIIDRDGDRILVPEASLVPEYLTEHSAVLPY
jgi:putative restriction endonuclease